MTKTNALVASIATALLLMWCSAAVAGPMVNYERAYDLGSASHIGDLGSIDGTRHIATLNRLSSTIDILSLDPTGVSLRSRITNPTGYWQPMLTVVSDIDGDGVSDIAASSHSNGEYLFSMLSPSIELGSEATLENATIYDIDEFLPNVNRTPRFANAQPDSSEFLLGEFDNTITRRDLVTGEILHEITGSGIGNGGTWVSDLDGDGIRDYLTGASHSGATVYAISGADTTNGTAVERAIRVFSDSETRGLGYAEDGNSIATSIGDLNNDGINEIAIGSREYIKLDGDNCFPFGCEGRVVVFDGGTGEVLYRLDADQSFQSIATYFGNNIVAPGDLDGDGFNDFIVSARGYSETQYDDRNGALVGYSGVDGAELFRLYGSPGETMGDNQVTLLSDLNGDGVSDLGVGSSYNNGSIWLSSIQNVPEPSAFILLSLGLAGLGLNRRRTLP